ncbi:MAG: prepilin peptidase, partial [Planctomycetaceae bacterium]|nr:prepilin peptidase [Planctomycetaceae bacterium]
LHAYSPKVWFEWGNESRALLYSMGLLGFWGIASMPKLCTLRFGLQRGLQLMLASVIRPRRHSLSSGEKRKRKPFTVTTLIAVSCMLGWVFLYAIWVWGDARQWESLFSSILGMTGGLVLVWGVRIIGSVAAQQEAMGFGDVTLMAMIGAFLGWQAVIITFFIAPFAGIVIGIIQAIVRKENELAFGPYLSLGAIIIVLFWETVWGRIYGVLNEQIDSVPFVLMLLLSAMGGMLFVWRIIKEKILA